jgi:hypothetical protein
MTPDGYTDTSELWHCAHIPQHVEERSETNLKQHAASGGRLQSALHCAHHVSVLSRTELAETQCVSTFKRWYCRVVCVQGHDHSVGVEEVASAYSHKQKWLSHFPGQSFPQEQITNHWDGCIMLPATCRPLLRKLYRALLNQVTISTNRISVRDWTVNMKRSAPCETLSISQASCVCSCVMQSLPSVSP